MEPNKQQKIKIIKLLAALYFLILGVFSFSASLYDNVFTWLDLVLLLFSCLPLIINKRIILLAFGMLAGCASIYIMYACLSFSLIPQLLTTGIAFFMGFVLGSSSLSASLALIYVGLQSSDKNQFSLI